MPGERDGGLCSTPRAEVHQTAGDISLQPLTEAGQSVGHGSTCVPGHHLGEFMLGTGLSHRPERVVGKALVHVRGPLHEPQQLVGNLLQDLVLGSSRRNIRKRLCADLPGLLDGGLGQVLGRFPREDLGSACHPEVYAAAERLRQCGPGGAERATGDQEFCHEPGSGPDDVTDHGAPRTIRLVFVLGHVQPGLDELLIGNGLSVLELLHRIGHGDSVTDRSSDRRQHANERKIRPLEVSQGVEEATLRSGTVPLGYLQKAAAGFRPLEVFLGKRLPEHRKSEDSAVGGSAVGQGPHIRAFPKRVGVESHEVPAPDERRHQGRRHGVSVVNPAELERGTGVRSRIHGADQP